MKRFKAFVYSLILSALISALAFPLPLLASGKQFDFLLSQTRYASGALNGGLVYFYATGGTTPKNVYTDIACTAAAANPYTLDANGTALLYGNGTYRVVLKTAAGVTVYDRDNIRVEDVLSGITGSGTGNLSGFDNLSLTGGITGDNTSNISGFDNGTFNTRLSAPSIGSASYTDNGFMNYLRAKFVYDNNALRVDDPQFGTLTYGLSASTAQRAANTTALQAAIDAAGEKALRFPGGIIAHDGLSVTKAVLWQGSGWDYPNGTVLAYFGSDNGITFVNASETGFVVRDMAIMGNSATPGSADNTTSGVMVHWQAGGLFENVYFWNTGGYGALLLGHTSVITFRHCKFQHNRLAGIYGRGIGTAQLNKINVDDCDIRDTYSGPGIDLWGTSISVHKSTLQSSDNACINMDASDTATASGMTNMSIRNNHFEGCKGGSIYSKTTADHLQFGLDIAGNYSYLNIAQVTDNAATTAHFIFTGTTGSTSQYYNARLGPNSFSGDMTYWARFDNTWNQYTAVDMGAFNETHFAKYLDLLNLSNGAGAQPRILHTGYASGAGIPASAPNYRNQMYWDTTNTVWWRSWGVADNTYWEVASRRPLTGTVAPGSTPIQKGMEYINTADNTVYKSVCTTDNTCWKALN